MKVFFVVLLTANVVVGAWLLLSGPVDMMREPARMELQIDPGKIRLLSDAEVSRMRLLAERSAAASAAAAAASIAAAAPKPQAPSADPRSISCVEIGDFASEAAAKKARARLAAIGLSDRTSSSSVGRTIRLRVTGLDAESTARINEILKDYPKQRLEHCPGTASAR